MFSLRMGGRWSIELLCLTLPLMEHLFPDVAACLRIHIWPKVNAADLHNDLTNSYGPTLI